MKKWLIAIVCAVMSLFADDELHMGLNYLEFASTDSVSVAGETLKTIVFTWDNKRDLLGITNITLDWIRIGSCSTGVKVGVFEGNTRNDWDMNTVLVTKRGAATGDTTATISLAGTTYLQFWVLCDDGGDSCYISRKFLLSVR